MNIRDIKLKYATPTSTTTIKTAPDMATLQSTLAAGTGETTLPGPGPYYEVKIENAGTTYTVNVPAFTLGLGSTGLYNIGVNKVSTIARELLAKRFEAAPTAFNLVNYQSERRTELNAQITAEAAKTNKDKKVLKKLRKDLKKVEKLKDKKVPDILTEQINGLETKVNAGVNITAPITARNMPAPVKSYLQDASSLEEKKVQKVNNPKKSKLQVFSGMKTFAQNHKTGIKRGLALAGAGVVTVTAIKTNGFGLFNGENKNTGTQVPTPTPGIHGTILTGTYSNEFNNAVSTNMTLYAPYRNILESTYGCSFEDIVRGYTFIENCGTMDTSNIGRNEMIKLITDGDKMIQLLVVNGQYGNISPEARNAIYGGFGTSVAYIQNNNAINGGSLLDYMTVGGAARTTLEVAVSNNQATTEDLLNLNSTIINPGLEVYLFKLENGLGASSLNNQKTLGTHPAMSRA